MRRRHMWAVILPAFIGAAGVQAENDLQLRRVTLFSSGVGFFESEAIVEGDAESELRFRADQINDILKSLVVQDLDGGTVALVNYASPDPIDKTLRSFAVNLTGNPPLAQLLGQLRGEPVQITGARTVSGVIVGLEKKQMPVGESKAAVDTDLLTLLTDEGLQQLRLSDVQGIRFTSEEINAEFRKALATLASAHDADKKSVSIRFVGQGRRRVRAAWLLESPIWKTSYRLVLGTGDDKPWLQGWANVENLTEEDWKEVRLSLVSGRPISFTMDLYSPLYVPRPHEELELYAFLRPPEYAAGFGGLAFALGERPEAAGAAVAPVPATLAPKQLEEERLARGMARRRSEDQKAAGRAGGRAPREELFAADESALGAHFRGTVAAVAQAQEAGELFEYVIESPVTIPRQRSAMLPIVNADVTAEKLSIYNPATHPRHPLHGLRLENTTGLHLMQGPLTVFDGGTYAGDAKLPDLAPGEKRLVAYALDLPVDVTMEEKPAPVADLTLRIVKGTLIHRHRYTDTKLYRVRNKDARPRTILIEQPYTPDWTLAEPKEPWEKTENTLRFRLPAPAGGTSELTVRLERIGEESITLSNCPLDHVEARIRALRGSVMSEAVRTALRRVVDLRMALDQAAREVAAAENELKEATAEQSRIRENLKVLRPEGDSYQRQLRKLDAIETQIEQIRDRIAERRKAHVSRQKALEDYLVNLTVEEQT